MIDTFFSITNNFSSWLTNHGISPEMAPFVRLIIMLTALFVLLFIIDFIVKKIMREGVKKIFLKTENKWDDVLIEKRVFAKLAHVFPALILNEALETLA